jgi:glycosyltransferase involved in cell wall biosynthesis
MSTLTLLSCRPVLLEAGVENLVELKVSTRSSPDGVQLSGATSQRSTIVSWSAERHPLTIVRILATIPGPKLGPDLRPSEHGIDVSVIDGSSELPLYFSGRAIAPREHQLSVRCHVAIAMATYNPPIELFRRQIASIREQSLQDWHCVISDDRSDNFDSLAEVIGGDDRFTLFPSPRRQGFYRNFERALSKARPLADYIALCDQDDTWHPDKLLRQVSTIGSHDLSTSHLAVVDSHGQVIREPMRPMQSPWLLDQIVANSIPGMSMLVTKRLLDRSLPFPDAAGRYHDQWLALCALAGSGVTVIPEELANYVQHGANVHGVAGFPAIDRGELWKKVLQPVRSIIDTRRCVFEANRSIDLALASLAVDRSPRTNPQLPNALSSWNSRSTRQDLSRAMSRNAIGPISPAHGFLLGLKLEQALAKSLITKQHRGASQDLTPSGERND